MNIEQIEALIYSYASDDGADKYSLCRAHIAAIAAKIAGAAVNVANVPLENEDDDEDDYVPPCQFCGFEHHDPKHPLNCPGNDSPMADFIQKGYC